ncbi:MAG TPA: flagellar protein FlgN [Syntrophomonadaceae bacterium]|nr:flagellar protein FlgN [Syntrophomonadaceae bacterium]
MQKLLQEFLTATSKINQALAGLADIGMEKQQLIIANKVKELDNLIRKEGLMVSNLTRLEKSRFDLQDRLAQELGVATPDLSADVLIEKTRIDFAELSAELGEQINQLAYKLTHLQAINMHNNELIEQSLEYIDLMQSLIDGDVAGTYSPQGQQTQETNTRPSVNLLDEKA